MRRPSRDPAVRRVALARGLLLAAFSTLALRAAHLSIVDERGERLGERQTNFSLSLAPERGTIFDRSDRELALTLDAPSVFAYPAEMKDPADAAARLAPILGTSRAELAKQLEGRRSFRYLARWIPREAAERISALGLPGVGVLEEPRRTYPHGPLAASLLGFANIDGVGVRGIEQLEDAWLRGRAQRLSAERDGSRRLLANELSEPWTSAGGDVRLTLDAAMQSAANDLLLEQIRATGARGGIVISLDPATGDVLALAEAPGFDPNRFREVRYAATRSGAFLDAVEPGSALKAFLVASALERGSLHPDDWIDCERGKFRVPGKTITDVKPSGLLRPADVLRVSSNIGSVKIAFGLGAESQYAMLRRFGFGAPTGSGFPEESAGLLRPRERWRPVDQATIAFGQGISVTAIQLAAATAALGNGGVWLPPRLVAGRRPPDGSWQPTPAGEGRRVVSAQTARRTLEMLQGVTGPDGTGKRAALVDLTTAGKTGTAQKLDRESGRYSNSRFVAWFIGVVPVESPRLAMVVALDEPRRPSHTGGAAAAPLFARVAAAQLARLGIQTMARIDAPALPAVAAAPPAAAAPAPTPAPAPVQAARAPVAAAKPPATAATPRAEAATPAAELARVGDRVLLPDFEGMSVAQVREITARHGLAVEISGNGRAIAQEPPPGTVVGVHGARIRVRFGAGANET